MVTNLKKQLWVSSSVIIGSVLLVTIALYFLSGNLAKSANAIATNRGLIDQQTSVLGGLADLKEQVLQAQPYQAAMDQLLPTQDGLIDFGEWLSNAANANQVSANSSFTNNISPASASTPGEAGFSFTANGSLSAIAAFLNDVESKAPGFFIQITGYDIAAANGNYQLSGQGNVFFRQ